MLATVTLYLKKILHLVSIIISYAENGGAVFCNHHAVVAFEGNSNIMFDNNNAKMQGGALLCIYNCAVTLKVMSLIQFTNNHAELGGALCSQLDFTFMVSGNSAITFSNNNAKEGGRSCIN